MRQSLVVRRKITEEEEQWTHLAPYAGHDLLASPEVDREKELTPAGQSVSGEWVRFYILF